MNQLISELKAKDKVNAVLVWWYNGAGFHQAQIRRVERWQEIRNHTT